MRTIMISDIHGCIKELDALLHTVSYEPYIDQLVLLGDYVDKGPNSKETVERVIELVCAGNAIALRGNHDQRLVDLIRLEAGSVKHKFLQHGGAETLRSYCDFIHKEIDDESLILAIQYIQDNYANHIAFLEKLPLYHEDDHHIYVHAGLNPIYENWRDQPDVDYMYIKGEFHRSTPLTDKIVVFGHTRSVELHHSSDIWFGQGKIGIDGGCAYGMQLNALIYEAGVYHTTTVRVSREDECTCHELPEKESF